MSGFIYIWLDRKDKRYYIGSHWGEPDDGYICSSRWMKQAYRNRPHDFKRRILKFVDTTRGDLLAEEYRYLRMIKPEELKTRYYNLAYMANGWKTEDQKKTVAEKISNTLTGRKNGPHSEETRKKMSLAQTGKKLSEETKEKVRQANLGKTYSEEVNSKKGRDPGYRHTDESRQRMSEANSKRTYSEEARAKFSEAAKRRKSRGPHSPETIEKMRIAAQNRKKK